MEYIIWLLEFICITFGCTDYLEASLLFPFIIGALVVMTIVLIAGINKICKAVGKIHIVKRINRRFENKVVGWQLDILLFLEKVLEALYNEFSWNIRYAKKKVGRKMAHLTRELRVLERKGKNK